MEESNSVVCGEVVKRGWSKEASYWIKYAYNLSKCDKNFVYLLEAENGKWTHDRKSDVVGINGYRDIGYCQINIGYHPHIVFDKRFLNDKEWQMQKCYELYKKGVTFYGFNKIHLAKKNIIFL